MSILLDLFEVFAFLLTEPSIVSWPFASIWHVEKVIDARDQERREDDDLEHKVEAVECRLGMIPSWIQRRAEHLPSSASLETSNDDGRGT